MHTLRDIRANDCTDCTISPPCAGSARHTQPMAVALWALGDDEAELAEWLAAHGMLPVGQPVHGITARARLMQRCEPRGDDGEPADG